MLAVFPGTFDPFTRGHMDILQRAVKIADDVVVAVCASPSKHTLFSLEQRVEMVQKCNDNQHVRVMGFSGLLTDLLKELHADFLIRGIRNTIDFEYELSLTATYRDFLPNLEVIMLPTEHKYSYVSSTLVREIHKHGGDISSYVPERIAPYFDKNLK